MPRNPVPVSPVPPVARPVEPGARPAADGRAVFLFVLWEASREKEEEVIRDLAGRFTVLKQFEVAWPQKDWISHLQAFYGHCSQVWIAKARRNGTGNFRVVVVEDHHAVYDYRDNLRGQKELVDLNVYDAKKRYRAMLKSKDKIHSSVNERETRHNLAMLLDQSLDDFLRRDDLDGAVETIVTAPPPDKGWRDFRHLFRILNECLPYVVLRNADRLRAPGRETDDDDIDILVSGLDEFVALTGAVKTDSKPAHTAYRLPVGSGVATLDVRVPEDGYYDPALSRDLLARGEIRDGIRVPRRPDHQFYSLLYHALIHKPAVAPGYAAYFRETAPALGLSGDASDVRVLRKWLAEWLVANRYAYCRPASPKVGFHAENRLPGPRVTAAARPRGRFVSCSAGLNKLKLHLLTGVNLPNIFRLQLRLGGLFKIDVCLGDVKEIGI